MRHFRVIEKIKINSKLSITGISQYNIWYSKRNYLDYLVWLNIQKNETNPKLSKKLKKKCTGEEFPKIMKIDWLKNELMKNIVD